MTDTDKTVAYGVTAEPSGFQKGMTDAANAAKSAADSIDSSFKKVQDVFAGVQKQLLMLAGLVAGGKFFKDAIAESVQLTGEAMKLSKMLGITGEEAATLRTALGDIGSNGDDYVATFTKFARQLKSNEEGLQSLGLKTRDANGNLRDSNTLFNEALHSVGDYKAGLDQNTYAQTLFGKSIDDVMKFQRLNNGVQDEAREKNIALGLTLSQEGVASSKAYKFAMNDVGDVLSAVQKTIGDAVMPVFTELANWFSDIGPTAVFVFKVAIDAVATAVHAALLALKLLGRLIGALVDPIFTVGRAFKMLISGDMNGATREMQNMLPNWGKAFEGLWEKIKTDSSKTWNEVTNLWGKGTQVGAPKGGPNTMGDFGKSNGTAKDTSRTSEWEAELAETKLKFQEQNNLAGTFYQFSKQEELKFWQDKQALTTKGTAEDIALRRKTADLQLGINTETFNHEMASLQAREAAYKNNMDAKLGLLQQEAEITRQRYGAESKEFEEVQKKIIEAKRTAAEQIKQIDMLRADAQRNASLAELQLAEQQAQLDRDLRTITNVELLAKQAQFEQQRFTIAMQAAKEREQLALADPDANPVQLAQLHSQIQQLEQQHQAKLTEIRGQATRESEKTITGVYTSMESGFAGVFAKTMQGGLTLQNTFKALWQTVVQSITTALAQIGAEWLMRTVAAKLMGKTAAVGEISANAGVAGAAAVASTAAIPVIGPALAPAAGALAMSEALSFMPMASAAGGYDIPGSINPIVQAHAQEMILPAKYADVIRRMGDRDAAQGPRGGGDTNVTISAHPMPGNYFMVHRDQLVKAIQSAKRDFAY